VRRDSSLGHTVAVDDWLTNLGPLMSFVTPRTRDLAVDGSGRVWTDDGEGFRGHDVQLDPITVRRIGATLIDSAGGRIDDAKPIGDAALAGTVRAHMVLPPVARSGPLLSLRFPARERIPLSQFTVSGAADFEHLHGHTTLVAGVTGSGKTTLASALIDQYPQSARVVIVEDIAELDPLHPHTVHLTVRQPNADGGGAVGLAELVRESLRMRPDVLVVGEIRGVEIREFFAAVTAGHRGLATIHAGSLTAVAARIRTLSVLAGIAVDVSAELACSAVSRIVFCSRSGDSFTAEVGEFAIADGELVVRPL